MKRQFSFFLFSLGFVGAFSLICSSCQKDKAAPYVCTGCASYPVSDIKKWMYFQPGTYWIYEEEASGAMDSVYVTNNTYDDGNTNSAYFRCETYSTYYNFYFNYLSNNPNQTGCYPTIQGEKRCLLLGRAKYFPGNFVGETTCFFYRPVLNSYAYGLNTSGNVTYVDVIIDSLIVSDSVYQNVVLMRETHNITENNQLTRFYFAERFGIIKKELVDSAQTWNLIRYNIVQ